MGLIDVSYTVPVTVTVDIDAERVVSVTVHDELAVLDESERPEWDDKDKFAAQIAEDAEEWPQWEIG